ncbi:MAG TPA: 50S ribosomal protein L5 [Acidobacteriota bacterium]
MPRLRERYLQEVLPRLKQELELENAHAVPRLEKIVINMGVGEATQNIKLLDAAAENLSHLSGQKAVVTRARKSIAAFKVREGQPIGCRVTLRGRRMWEFLDRLISIALPRVKDFRGLSNNAFDGRGNYTVGLKDQLIFPEIDYEKVSKLVGMNITIVTTASEDAEARLLLEQLGLPLRRT